MDEKVEASKHLIIEPSHQHLAEGPNRVEVAKQSKRLGTCLWKEEEEKEDVERELIQFNLLFSRVLQLSTL